jgi:hypothetical protein
MYQVWSDVDRATVDADTKFSMLEGEARVRDNVE